MPVFSYIAINNKGVQEKGVIFANSQQDVYQQLKISGKTLIKLQKPYFKKLKFYNHQELSTCLLYLASFLEQKISLTEGIKILVHSSTEKKIWQEINLLISNGSSLYHAMAHFPSFFSNTLLALVRAGERSGNLALAFQQGHKWLNQNSHHRQQFWQSLRYPIMLLVSLILLITLMVNYVVPEIYQLLKSMGVENQSFATITLLKTVEILKSLPWLNILFLLLIFFVGSFLPIFKDFKDRLLHKLPLLGRINFYYHLSMWLSTLGTSLKCQINFSEALEIANDGITDNNLRKKFAQVLPQLQQGQNLHLILTTQKIMPDFVIKMIQLGIELAVLDVMLLKASDMIEKEYLKQINNIFSWTSPLMIVIIGIMMIWIVIATILPLYDHLANLA